MIVDRVETQKPRPMDIYNGFSAGSDDNFAVLNYSQSDFTGTIGYNRMSNDSRGLLKLTDMIYKAKDRTWGAFVGARVIIDTPNQLIGATIGIEDHLQSNISILLQLDPYITCANYSIIAYPYFGARVYF